MYYFIYLGFSSHYGTDRCTETCPAKSRSSRPEVFCKKGVLRNFAKFTEKHLCQRLFFNKVARLRPATLLKKRLWYKATLLKKRSWHRCFPVNFVKFLIIPFLTEYLRWLLLKELFSSAAILKIL